MSAIYDNWERLVRATLREEQLRLCALREFSDLSLSSFSSFNSSSSSPVSDLNGSSLLVGEAFDYDHILCATNYLSNSNLIRHGRSGDLFRGVLDGGTPIAVKRIDCSLAENKRNCRSELEAFAKASHPRFVSLLGCLGTTDEKFLIYNYMSNRDLSRFLSTQAHPIDHQVLQSLNWATRLRIATGAAEALCFLHHECVPPLVHRDVQASSIFLDDIYDVKLGSLSNLCAQKNKTKQNRITNLLRLPRGSKKETPGGRASNATCAYDVYCFGKVLLELITGELGSGANGYILNSRMQDTLSYITINNVQLVREILDPSLVINDDLLVEVWAMAVIAKACLISQPSIRPPVISVLKALETSRHLIQSKMGVPKVGRAELEIALEDFSNVIGFTTLGTLYKGTLSSGVKVAVLNFPMDYNYLPEHWSLKHGEQFREKVVSLSKVNHKNFVNLVGYCEEEKAVTRMMIFEYAPNGTLFEHLHIKKAELLDWAMRMRIVMGIAYCLVHMHQLTPPLTHGHLNSTEVYLTEDYAAKISDFKLQCEVDMAWTQPNPEEDVYGFGFLLWEVVTGKMVGIDSLNWASEYMGGKQLRRETVDPTLSSFDIDQIVRVDEIIESCTNPVPSSRPAMREVAARLRQATGIGPYGAIPKPSCHLKREKAELEFLSTTVAQFLIDE